MCCWSLSRLGLWRHVYQNLIVQTALCLVSQFIIQAVFPGLFLKVLRVCLSHLSQVSHPPGAPAAAEMGDTTQSPAGDPITLDTHTQSPSDQPVSSDTYRLQQMDNSVSWRRPHSMWMNVSMQIWDYSSFWRTLNSASDTHATLLPRVFRYDLLHSVWVCVCVWIIKPSFTVHIPLNEGSHWFVFQLILKLYLYNHCNLMGMYELNKARMRCHELIR